MHYKRLNEFLNALDILKIYTEIYKPIGVGLCSYYTLALKNCIALENHKCMFKQHIIC